MSPRLSMAALTLLLSTGANAHIHNVADTDWMNSLTNRRNGSCCNQNEGTRIDDVDWVCEDDNHCRVRIKDKWINLPEHTILDARKNRNGYAVIWIKPSNGEVVCFLPGALT